MTMPSITTTTTSSTTFAVAFLIAFCHLHTSGQISDTLQTITWCLDPGNPQQLLNLTCRDGSLIYISLVVHGWRENGTITPPPPPEGSCLAPASDGCLEKYPNIYVILNECSGVENCSVSSLLLPAGLVRCSGKTSNYLQIYYECMTFIVDNQSVVADVCGGRINASSSPQQFGGYIVSANYPGSYPANARCSCSLMTPGQSATPEEIVLEVLDYDVSLIPNDRSPGDWLQMSRGEQIWGDGQMLGGIYLWGPVYTGSQLISVNFNTNDQNEGRGFWLRYTGIRDDTKEEVPVAIKCSVYYPPEYRTAVSCFEAPNNGELYLSCTSFGVINVQTVETGAFDGSASGEACQNLSQAVCKTQLNSPDILNMCMKRTLCLPPAPSTNLTACNHSSNYIRVVYQCIPDSPAGEPSGMIDVCGESRTPGTTVIQSSGVGYINTPLYPSNYPPNSNCYCHLETSSDAEIILSLVDLNFVPATTAAGDGNSIDAQQQQQSAPASDCSDDWLEYALMNQTFGTGKKLCSAAIGEPIYTGASVVLLNFHSDYDIAGRGFWMQYVGRTANGTNQPVVLHCGMYEQLSTTTVMGSNPKENVYENNIIGLTVGLVFVGLCIVVVLCVCIAYFWCFHRVHSERSNTTSSSGSSGADTDSQCSTITLDRMLTSAAAPARERRRRITVFRNQAYRMDPTQFHDLSEEKKKIPTNETVYF